MRSALTAKFSFWQLLKMVGLIHTYDDLYVINALYCGSDGRSRPSL